MPTLSESHIRHIHNLDILDFLRAQCAEEMPSALSDEALTALRKKVEAHIKATYLSGASSRGGETGFESVDGVELTRKIFLRRINRQRRFVFEMLGIPSHKTCNVGRLFCQI